MKKIKYQKCNVTDPGNKLFNSIRKVAERHTGCPEDTNKPSKAAQRKAEQLVATLLEGVMGIKTPYRTFVTGWSGFGICLITADMDLSLLNAIVHLMHCGKDFAQIASAPVVTFMAEAANNARITVGSPTKQRSFDCKNLQEIVNAVHAIAADLEQTTASEKSIAARDMWYYELEMAIAVLREHPHYGTGNRKSFFDLQID